MQRVRQHPDGRVNSSTGKNIFHSKEMFVNYNHLPWTINPQPPAPPRQHGTIPIPTPIPTPSLRHMDNRSSSLFAAPHPMTHHKRFLMPPFVSLSSKLTAYQDRHHQLPNTSTPTGMILPEPIPYKFPNYTHSSSLPPHHKTETSRLDTNPKHIRKSHENMSKPRPPKSFNVRDILTPQRESSTVEDTTRDQNSDSGMDKSAEKYFSHAPRNDEEGVNKISSSRDHFKKSRTFPDANKTNKEIVSDNIIDKNVSYNNNNNNICSDIPTTVFTTTTTASTSNNNNNNNHNISNNSSYSAFFPVSQAPDDTLPTKDFHQNRSPGHIKGSDRIPHTFNDPWSVETGQSSTTSRSYPNYVTSIRHHRHSSASLSGNYDDIEKINRRTLSESPPISAPLPSPPSSSSFASSTTSSSSSSLSLTRIYHSSQDRKKFQCPQCRYITDRKNNLMRHIITMHQDSGKVLECCGIAFQSKSALREHNSIFHSGGYRCQICSRNFCRKALLRRHLTVHSGQKDFYCELCGYATSHKSNLERHQKVHSKRYMVRDGKTRYVDVSGYSHKGIDINHNQTSIDDSVRNIFFKDGVKSSALSVDDNVVYNIHQRSDNIDVDSVNGNDHATGISTSSEEDSDFEIVDVDILSEDTISPPLRVSTHTSDMDTSLNEQDTISYPRSHKKLKTRRPKIFKRRGFFTTRIQSTHGPETISYHDNASLRDEATTIKLKDYEYTEHVFSDNHDDGNINANKSLSTGSGIGENDEDNNNIENNLEENARNVPQCSSPESTALKHVHVIDRDSQTRTSVGKHVDSNYSPRRHHHHLEHEELNKTAEGDDVLEYPRGMRKEGESRERHDNGGTRACCRQSGIGGGRGYTRGEHCSLCNRKDENDWLGETLTKGQTRMGGGGLRNSLDHRERLDVGGGGGGDDDDDGGVFDHARTRLYGLGRHLETDDKDVLHNTGMTTSKRHDIFSDNTSIREEMSYDTITMHSKHHTETDNTLSVNELVHDPNAITFTATIKSPTHHNMSDTDDTSHSNDETQTHNTVTTHTTRHTLLKNTSRAVSPKKDGHNTKHNKTMNSPKRQINNNNNNEDNYDKNHDTLGSSPHLLKNPRLCLHLYSCHVCHRQFQRQIEKDTHECLKEPDTIPSSSLLNIPITTAFRKGNLTLLQPRENIHGKQFDPLQFSHKD